MKLRKLFFRTVSTMVDAEPLPVDWPAGEVVFTMSYFPSLMAWCWDNQVIGITDPLTSTLCATIPGPMKCFFWPDAPATAKIISVKIDGVEQLAPTADILGVMFQKRPYSYEAPRLWWGWSLLVFFKLFGAGMEATAAGMWLRDKGWKR